MTMKAMIKKINEVALEDFDRAKGMLDAVNMIAGLHYGWLNRRVVWFDNPFASTCNRGCAHDAYVTAEDIELNVVFAM